MCGDSGEVGTGNILMTDSDAKSTGTIGVAQGEESSGIIMVDDFPRPGAGNVGSFSKNIIGQPVNGINRAADIIKHGREAVDRIQESNSLEALKCIECGDTVHFDSPMQIEWHSGGDPSRFDTIKVENK